MLSACPAPNLTVRHSTLDVDAELTEGGSQNRLLFQLMPQFRPPASRLRLPIRKRCDDESMQL
jgi:hypothetical protein